MKKPVEQDKQIGALIRHYRKLNGVTQSDLAKFLGVTFQQVQKYELGTNRVSAGRLFRIAVYLRTDVSRFFDGLCKADPDLAEEEAVFGMED